MHEDEIERRREIFIRGNCYSPDRLRKICTTLTAIGLREIIPYEVVQYEIVESGWEENRLYVITTRFIESNIYDVRIYLPQERQSDKRYGRCWERAVEVAEKQKVTLKSYDHKVIYDLEIYLFKGYPKPPVPCEVMTIFENFGAVDLALRWRRTTGF